VQIAQGCGKTTVDLGNTDLPIAQPIVRSNFGPPN
jgi:hypothetical protein